MAEDLASFIESQKRKLEQERAEMSRSQETEDRSRTSPRGHKPDNRHGQVATTPASETRTKAKVATLEEDNDVGGLKLGGYEKHQQRLRQERKEDYRKYLAELLYIDYHVITISWMNLVLPQADGSADCIFFMQPFSGYEEKLRFSYFVE